MNNKQGHTLIHVTTYTMDVCSDLSHKLSVALRGRRQRMRDNEALKLITTSQTMTSPENVQLIWYVFLVKFLKLLPLVIVLTSIISCTL